MANLPIEIRVKLTYNAAEVRTTMPNYEKMYYTLFNAITDALRLMETEQYPDAAILHAAAQRETEELYMTE